MSLTNIVYTPVDTGRAKVRPKGQKAKGRFFYLLTGKWTSNMVAIIGGWRWVECLMILRSA